MGIPLPAIPAQAAPGGGSTIGAIVFITTVVGLLVDRFTDIDVFDAVSSAPSRIKSMIPFIGGPSRSSGNGGGVMGFFSSGNGLVITSVVVFTLLFAGGLLDLPEGANLQIIVAIELVGVFAVLRELDIENTMEVFVIIAVVTILLGLSAMGEPVIGAIAQSDVFPLLAIGGLGLGAYGLYLYRKKVQKLNRPKLVVRRGGE